MFSRLGCSVEIQLQQVHERGVETDFMLTFLREARSSQSVRPKAGSRLLLSVTFLFWCPL